MNLRVENCFKVDIVKTQVNFEIFRKMINCPYGTGGQLGNLSRSRMKKRTSQLNSSSEI